MNRYRLLARVALMAVAFTPGVNHAQMLSGAPADPNYKYSTPMPRGIAVPPTLDTRLELISKSPLRNGPGMNFDEIATLPQGAKIQIVGASPDINWYLILYDDPQGLSIQAWIPAESVKIVLQASQMGYLRQQQVQF